MLPVASPVNEAASLSPAHAPSDRRFPERTVGVPSAAGGLLGELNGAETGEPGGLVGAGPGGSSRQRERLVLSNFLPSLLLPLPGPALAGGCSHQCLESASLW